MQDQQLFPGIAYRDGASPEAMRLVSQRHGFCDFWVGKILFLLSQKKLIDLAQIKGEVAVAPTKSMNLKLAKKWKLKKVHSGFVGIIDKIDEESEKLTVMVSIFGRMTPVELRFDQVKR